MPESLGTWFLVPFVSFLRSSVRECQCLKVPFVRVVVVGVFVRVEQTADVVREGGSGGLNTGRGGDLTLGLTLDMPGDNRPIYGY